MALRSHAEDAKRRFDRGQLIGLTVCGIVIAVGAVSAPITTMRCVVGIYLVYIFGFLLLRVRAVLRTMRADEETEDRDRHLDTLPRFSLLCPLYDEAESVPNLIASLRRLDYPDDRYEILLLLEAEDLSTRQEAERHEGGHVKVVVVPMGGVKTKPRALNVGILAATGDIIGIYDAEDRPETGQLLAVAAAMRTANPPACVQARLNYYNKDDGLITRMFALEYALHFDWYLPGLASLGLPLPLGGTSNFVCREALENVGGWDPYNVTEDADLGLRLAAHGYRIATVDSTTYEEATFSVKAWIRQRSRWIKGFMQTAAVHSRKGCSWRSALVLHFAILAVPVSAIVSPPLWALLIGSFFGFFPFTDEVFAGSFGGVCLAAFLLGNLSHAWLLMMAPVRRDWFELSPAGIFLPLYWILQSVAGYIALAEFVRAPHYWAKTEHSPGDDPRREVQSVG
ncbi:MAG: glycosyltransferase [Parvularcula sp.]|jgi:cellulose synthase/poly-beta-1,6-N-acetylglucosamine synthase-like glycosyltransferase|nr:glycosyltransferase [Parvularcula sp.]